MFPWPEPTLIFAIAILKMISLIIVQIRGETLEEATWVNVLFLLLYEEEFIDIPRFFSDNTGIPSEFSSLILTPIHRQHLLGAVGWTGFWNHVVLQISTNKVQFSNYAGDCRQLSGLLQAFILVCMKGHPALAAKTHLLLPGSIPPWPALNSAKGFQNKTQDGPS